MAAYLKLEHCEWVQRYRFTAHPPRTRVKLRPTHAYSHKVAVVFYEPRSDVTRWLNEFTPLWKMDRETRRMRFAEPHHDFAFQMRWG